MRGLQSFQTVMMQNTSHNHKQQPVMSMKQYKMQSFNVIHLEAMKFPVCSVVENAHFWQSGILFIRNLKKSPGYRH